MSKIFQDALNEIPEYLQEKASLILDTVDQIHEILTRKGMSQKDLATLLNKSESEVSKWMRGTHNFTFETIAKISTALGERIIITPKAAKQQYAPELLNIIRENKECVHTTSQEFIWTKEMSEDLTEIDNIIQLSPHQLSSPFIIRPIDLKCSRLVDASHFFQVTRKETTYPFFYREGEV